MRGPRAVWARPGCFDSPALLHYFLILLGRPDFRNSSIQWLRLLNRSQVVLISRSSWSCLYSAPPFFQRPTGANIGLFARTHDECQRCPRAHESPWSHLSIQKGSPGTLLQSLHELLGEAQPKIGALERATQGLWKFNYYDSYFLNLKNSAINFIY